MDVPTLSDLSISILIETRGTPKDGNSWVN